MKLRAIFRRAALLCLAAALSASMCLTAHAEEISRSGWTADFTGDAIQSNFNAYDWYAAMCELLPGDSAVLRVDIKNTSKEYVQWYLSNSTLQTLEESRTTARDGGYAYKLTYTSNGVSGNIPNNGSDMTIDGGTKQAASPDTPSGGTGYSGPSDVNGYSEDVSSQSVQYICNTGTKKIHTLVCRDVPSIAPENVWRSSSDMASLISRGYSACGHCHPVEWNTGALSVHAGEVQPQTASNTIVLFDSETVSGDGGAGLYEATDGLGDFFKLCTMAPGGSGYVTLYVKLDGETQGNGYQNTLARLRLNFAVNIIPANYIEVPGDPTKVTIQDPPTRIEIPGDPTYVIPDGNPPLSDIPQYTTVPQTGDSITLAVFSTIAMLCGMGGVIAFVMWSRKDKAENAGKEARA